MLVYGDHVETANAGERLEGISERLAAVAAMPLGIGRHGKLVGAFVEAGQLLQGVADAGLDTRPMDIFLRALAVAVLRSWAGRFTAIGKLPAAPRLYEGSSVQLRLPEGFAFYAVYPEAYATAARQLQLAGPPRVIGVRSIGTTLGAIVAAALDAPAPVSVRPFGDPFARQVKLPASLLGEEFHYVIVDEGPGLSGSSFGGVADWLEARGVPLERIAFLPSHGGDPGPQASDAHRRRWHDAQRVPAQFDATFLSAAFGPIEPFTTGSAGERRKFFAAPNGERLLLKFAGLGAIGERKLEMARALHVAGFTPEPMGLVHGFLIEHWESDAAALGPDDKPVEEIGRYIGARARLFPAQPSSGASIAELAEMCRRNISLALGCEAAREVDRFDADGLQKRVARVRTDNKIDQGEWLRRPNGKLIKTDALDHHQGHDLIGCQDMAWDIAGAIAEFQLDANATASMIAATGRSVDADLLEFYRLAYAAFRLGHAELSGAGRAAVEPYVSALQLLAHEGAYARKSAGIRG